jgi:uncharacterized HAD superfamily protein
MKIGVDLDGCVFDFVSHFMDFYNRLLGLDDKPEDATSWDWWDCPNLKITQEEFFKAVKQYTKMGYPQEQPIISGATESLIDIANDNHEIVYISDRPSESHRITINSLLDHNLPINSVIFCKSKEKASICKAMGINICIEDKPSTVIDYAQNGIDVGFHIYSINKNEWNNIQVEYKDSEMLGRIHPIYSFREFKDLVRDSSVQEGPKIRD